MPPQPRQPPLLLLPQQVVEALHHQGGSPTLRGISLPPRLPLPLLLLLLLLLLPLQVGEVLPPGCRAAAEATPPQQVQLAPLAADGVARPEPLAAGRRMAGRGRSRGGGEGAVHAGGVPVGAVELPTLYFHVLRWHT